MNIEIQHNYLPIILFFIFTYFLSPLAFQYLYLIHPLSTFQTINFIFLYLFQSNILHFPVSMSSFKHHRRHNRQQQLTHSSNTQRNLKSSKLQEKVTDNELVQIQDEGVKGKNSRLIRAISFIWLVITVALVYVLGAKSGQVSKKYFLYVTPPPLYFIIWAIIFTLKVVFNLINIFKNKWGIKQHILLAVDNALLILWTIVFNLNNNPAVFSAFFILIPITPVVLSFWSRVGRIKPNNWFNYCTRNSYAFYLGWIVAATNLNFGILIVYWWNSSLQNQLITFFVVAPVCAISITILNVWRQQIEGLKSCFCLWLSVIWALTGAAYSSINCINNNDCIS